MIHHDDKTLAHHYGRLEASIEYTPRCFAILPHMQFEWDAHAWHLWFGWGMHTITLSWWRDDVPYA